MKAIEFVGNVENGTIKVPKEYISNLAEHEVRVIILLDEKEIARRKKKQITSLQIETKNLHFDRDEANER